VRRLKLVVADDHTLVRAGFRALLERMPHVEVVGEAANGREVIELVAERRPDIALVNISMPELNGLDATARIVKDHPKTRVILVSLHSDEEYVRRGFALGAAGYLVKSADVQELELAIRAVARGDLWVSPSVSKAIVAALARGERPSGSFELLTSRQREVLQMVAEGKTAKEIADELQLSVKTVESHRSQLMKRLGVRGIPGLVRSAIRLGLIAAQD
jgi:DNA-binding NarL/FixJ family response regulator